MSFNVLSAVLHVAEPLGPVLHKELLDQVLRHGVDVPGPVDLAAEDLLVDPEGVVVKEGRISSQHLVDEYAEGPPVHRLVVTLREGLEILSLSSTTPYLGLDDLRGEVLRGAAEGPGPVTDPLGEPEVCDLQVSVPATSTH